jgi:hypothetical protein
VRKQVTVACRLGGVALLAALLTSCGGGDGESVVVPLDTVRVACAVADAATGAAVADATVNYQAGATEYTTQTSPNGSCALLTPAAEVAGVAFPAASVIKEGYEPQTILCPELQGGESCTRDVALIPLARNVSIPVGGDIVMHLGDDQYEGAVNSQFQKKSDGAQLTFVIADWEAKVQAGYTKATVYIDVKGWQTNRCQNLIGLAGDAGEAYLPGGDSPTEGYWGGGKQVPFEFKASRVGSQWAELRIIAPAHAVERAISTTLRSTAFACISTEAARREASGLLRLSKALV